MKKKLFICIVYIAPMLFLHGAYANEGLDTDFAILKINKEIKSLNKKILSLKDEIDLIKENQRINSSKITELLQMFELNLSNNKKEETSTVQNQVENLNTLYSDGKNPFALGNYEQAILLLINFEEASAESSSVKDLKLWLARAYSANKEYLKSKDEFLEFQSNNKSHTKYPDSMFELSRVLIKLNEVNEAKLLLLDMINKYPRNSLINKANQLLLDL